MPLVVQLMLLATRKHEYVADGGGTARRLHEQKDRTDRSGASGLNVMEHRLGVRFEWVIWVRREKALALGDVLPGRIKPVRPLFCRRFGLDLAKNKRRHQQNGKHRSSSGRVACKHQQIDTAKIRHIVLTVNVQRLDAYLPCDRRR